MKITNQETLAALTDAIFQDGALATSGLIFKQLHFLDSRIKKQLLEEIYQDSLTADYSFEAWNTKTSEVVDFFTNAPIEKQKTHFLVFDKNNVLLGRCMLRVSKEEIHFGYALCASKQNQGFGTRILRTLFDICFEKLHLTQYIYGSTMSHNIPSQKAMGKAGMIAEGCVEKSIELALDTRWLEYKINHEIYKSQITSQMHPGSRRLRDVILHDYRTSSKEKRVYSASEFGRIKFFLKKEVFLAPKKESASNININCVRL